MCRFLLCNDLRSGLGVELGVDRPPKEWEWEWIKKIKALRIPDLNRHT